VAPFVSTIVSVPFARGAVSQDPCSSPVLVVKVRGGLLAAAAHALSM